MREDPPLLPRRDIDSGFTWLALILVVINWLARAFLYRLCCQLLLERVNAGAELNWIILLDNVAFDSVAFSSTVSMRCFFGRCDIDDRNYCC